MFDAGTDFVLPGKTAILSEQKDSGANTMLKIKVEKSSSVNLKKTKCAS